VKVKNTTTIRAKVREGYQEIEALVIGKFAVHPMNLWSFEDSALGDDFTITHVATGLAMAEIHRFSTAKRVAGELDSAITEDITTEDRQGHTDRFKAFGKAARAVIWDAQPAQEGQ
jgi:hypothetical protein